MIIKINTIMINKKTTLIRGEQKSTGILKLDVKTLIYDKQLR